MTELSPPRVTVGIPVFNGEEYLAEAIESFLAQTYAAFRLIISDNASTDGTPAIAQHYAQQDRRVQYARNPVNIGVAGNYRRLIDLADTEYFRWAAADDRAAPEALERCVDVLDKDARVVLAYPQTVFVGPDGSPLQQFDETLACDSPSPSARFAHVIEHIARGNAMYGVARTAVVRQMLPLGAFRASDYCFLAELSLYGHLHQVSEVLFYRRFHQSASSALNQDDLKHFYRPWSNNDGRPDALYWTHYFRHARAILRTPIRVREKARGLRTIGRWMRWQRATLMAELGAVLRWRWHRLRGKGPPHHHTETRVG